MVFLNWVLNNWYWALAGYAGAFALYVSIFVRNGVRDERARLNLARACADSDSYGDDHYFYVRSGFDNFPVRCGSGDGTVLCDEHQFCPDSHAANGAGVRSDAKAVA